MNTNDDDKKDVSKSKDNESKMLRTGTQQVLIGSVSIKGSPAPPPPESSPAPESTGGGGDGTP